MTDIDPLNSFRAGVARPDDARRQRIRADFRSRIASTPPDDRGRRPFDPPATGPVAARETSRRPALALAGLVVIVGLAAAGALVLRDTQNGPTSLPELAVQAGAQPDVTLDDGQYLYRVEHARQPGEDPVQRQQWTAPNGSGQATTTALTLGSPREPALTVYPAPGDLDFAGLSYDDLRSLPTEPTALLARLESLGAVRDDTDAGRAEALADVLALSVTPPEVASAAVAALGQLGGEAIGPRTDPDGRGAMAIRGGGADGTWWTVLLAPQSGRAIGFYADSPNETLDDAARSRRWSDEQITTSLAVP